jgi:hypothetical protein
MYANDIEISNVGALTKNDPSIMAGVARLAEKAAHAKMMLGAKWVLHPSHAPKNKNRATASSKFFLGV